MGLYLALFSNGIADEEIDGVEVGGYDDFGDFRTAVHELLEPGEWGSRYPILMSHPDATGVWPAGDLRLLEAELIEIRDRFMRLPPRRLDQGWQREQIDSMRMSPTSLHESFFDIDGQPLLDRLLGLLAQAQRVQQPILFQ